MAFCKIVLIVFIFVAVLSPCFGNPVQNCTGEACQVVLLNFHITQVNEIICMFIVYSW